MKKFVLCITLALLFVVSCTTKDSQNFEARPYLERISTETFFKDYAQFITDNKIQKDHFYAHKLKNAPVGKYIQLKVYKRSNNKIEDRLSTSWIIEKDSSPIIAIFKGKQGDQFAVFKSKYEYQLYDLSFKENIFFSSNITTGATAGLHIVRETPFWLKSNLKLDKTGQHYSTLENIFDEKIPNDIDGYFMTIDFKEKP